MHPFQITPELWAKQEDLETEMADLGARAIQREIERGQNHKDETGTVYGQGLLKVAILPTSIAIEQFMERASSGKAGRRHAALKFIQQVDPKVAAYLTAKTVLDSISIQVVLQTTAIELGSRIEDEVRFQQFRAEHKAYYDKTREGVMKRTSNTKWHRTVITHAGNKLGVEWVNWTDKEKLHLGMKLIDLFIEATDMVRIEHRRTGAKETKNFIRPTEGTMEKIQDKTNAACRSAMQALPMVVPPKGWSDPTDGGYYFMPHRRLPMVKTRNKNYLEELRNADLQSVQESLEDIQNTGWKINRQVVDVLEYVYENNLPHGKLPPVDDLPMPAKPSNFETDEGAMKDWKREAADTHSRNAKMESKRIQVRLVIDLSRKFQDEQAIFFPYQMDFRGRVYAVPMFLQPQGADWAKGCLTFSEGKAITDERAAGWLAIQGANTFGFDKASLEDRVEWAFEAAEDIKCVAADPLVHTWWADADKPWQFLAWCFEFAAFLEHGYGYVSSLPVALDGSCNGLQHFSAMLRDSVGGAAVNLLPSEKPEDIYQRVADRVIEKLNAMVGDPEIDADTQALATEWLAFGISRKTTKRSVMVLPYGGTQFACRKYVEEYVRENAAVVGSNPWGNDTFRPASFLAKIVWASIGEVVVAARQCMDWLQKTAKVSASEGLPITWETPDGFPVLQAYPDMSETRVKTQVSGTAMFLTVSTELPTLDKRRQQNGIAPNYVHSMDAAALRKYVLLFKDNMGDQSPSLSLVHDSFGTLAADTDVSVACLREAFAQMYRDNDVLEQFAASIREMLPEEKHGDLPAIPAKGDLDIEAVLESEYFFA